jgi:hypothetical protein
VIINLEPRDYTIEKHVITQVERSDYTNGSL